MKTYAKANLKPFQYLPILLAAMLVSGSSGAFGQAIRVTLNGEPIQFPGVGPQQVRGRVLVPVRGVLERLGAQLSWLPQSQTVIASNARMDIQLGIGERAATVNGKSVMLDVPAQIIAGSTMVPLRFLGEALGADVGWDNATRTVQIVTSGENAPPNEESAPSASTGTPVIRRITHNGGKWLRAGSHLRVTMDGTPNGRAAFRVPGLTEDIAMREAEPGRYTGEWQVPEDKPLSLGEGAIIGSLRVNNREAPLLQSGQSLVVDSAPPRLRDRAPEPDTRVGESRPKIYAVFDDRGSGIDPNGVRLSVNGRDVTSEANVTRTFISYTPPNALPAGSQTVLLTLTDKAGNRARSQWKFINGQEETAGIRLVRISPSGRLEPGDVLRVAALGAPGGRATFSIGDVVTQVRMTETVSGRYQGTYTVRRGDDIADAPVRVTLVTSAGEKYTREAPQRVGINTGKLMKPTITSPEESDEVSSPLVIKGKGAPNTRVRVKVDYQSRLLGVIALRGVAADTFAEVDRNGNWQTEPIEIGSLLSKQNMTLTVAATGYNANDETSETVSLKLGVR